MKKNILFSTTRQWNPGDEFILMGCINLLKEVVGEFNPIIYNRNPEVRQEFDYLNPLKKITLRNSSSRYITMFESLLESFIRIGFLDNSFKDDTKADFINMVVFAGSPEWRCGKINGRLRSLYKIIVKHGIPTIFLGIGTKYSFNYYKMWEINKKVLKDSKLMTCRDEYTYNALQGKLDNDNLYYMPCPALYSSSFEKEIKKVKKIGLIFGTDKTVENNKINSNTYKFLLNTYKQLINNYDCEIVCHYIDEVPEACRLFKDVNIHYSYDSKDYLDIYKKFDIVIGPRVHGIGISASMGIPGILIAHDMRGNTGKGFMAKIITDDKPYEQINGEIENILNNIQYYNNQLITHKYKYKKEYIKLLNNCFE